jgi:hypothetical protein
MPAKKLIFFGAIAFLMGGCLKDQNVLQSITGTGDAGSSDAGSGRDGSIADSGTDAGVGRVDAGSDGGVGSVTCLVCVTSNDCGPQAACVQYGGSDYCAQLCGACSNCASNQDCILAVAFNGVEAQVCVPESANCNGLPGCLLCPMDTNCDFSTGTCSAEDDGGLSGSDSGSCGTFEPPSVASCCTSCAVGGGNCQPNGCYGGWWCDSATCRCHAPPTSCGSAGGPDAGDGGTCAGTSMVSCCHSCTPGIGDCQANGCYGGWLCQTSTCLCESPSTCASDGGIVPPDGGANVDAGGIGPNGGVVTSLYFAVVGDTRPANQDDTPNYPTQIIDQIFRDLEAMSPKPQFVLSTGDYMFADPSGTQGAAQVHLYVQSATKFSNILFPVMGNQECTGSTSSNCSGSPTNNYNAYLSGLVTPLGKSEPYYSVPITASDGSWSAKLIVLACNAWDSTQAAWFSTQLGTATTYTFVSRHEPSSAANAPCVSTTDSMLSQTSYDLLITGHSHTFDHPTNQEIIVGNGGAPISGPVDYGYATIQQQPGGGFLVTEYDYLTAAPVTSFTVQ